MWSSWCRCHPISSCFNKIQNWIIFLVLAYLDCPGKKTIKQVMLLLSGYLCKQDIFIALYTK